MAGITNRAKAVGYRIVKQAGLVMPSFGSGIDHACFNRNQPKASFGTFLIILQGAFAQGPIGIGKITCMGPIWMGENKWLNCIGPLRLQRVEDTHSRIVDKLRRLCDAFL